MNRAVGTLLPVSALCLAAFAQEPLQYVNEKIAAGYRFTEGPAWSKDGFLIFSDTPNDLLLKWVPGRLPEVYRKVPELRRAKTTSLHPLEILRCLRLKVWCVETQSMVGVRGL